MSFNTNFEILTGFGRDDLLHASADMIIHPDDWAGIYALYRKRIAGEACPRGYDTRIIRKNGEMRKIHLNASPVTWKGKPAVLYLVADTTELRETEGRLEETDKKYRFVVENATEGIFVVQEGMIRFANPKVLELTVYSSDRWMNQQFIEFVHPDDRDYVQRTLQKALDMNGTAVHGSFRLIDATGGVRVMNLSGVSVRWEGKPATLNFVHDVTDFRETLEQRKCIEEKFKKLVEIVQEGILVMDPVGTITYANPYFAGMLGYAPGDMIGRSFLEFLSEADAKIIPPSLAPRNHSTRSLYEFVFIRRDGKRIFANFVISPIHDFKGYVSGSVAVVSDITERKSAEKALQESREELKKEGDKLQGILDGMNDGVCIINQYHEVTYCNPVMIRAFGQVRGRPCHEYLNGSDTPCPTCKNHLVLQGSSMQSEWTSGVTGRTYDLFETPLPEPGGKTSKLAIFHDISHLKHIEKNLEQSEGKLSNTLQGLPVAALMIDMSHQVVHWNHAMELLTGIPAQGIVRGDNAWRLALYSEQRPWLADIVLDEHLEEMKRWYGNKVCESRRIPGAYEATDFFAHLGPGGKWLHATARTIHDAEGTVIGAVETIEDLTEQKKMEQQIIDEKNRAKNLLDIAGVMILAIDSAGKVTLINQKGCEILGCDKKDIIGKTWADTFIPERAREGIQSIFSGLVSGDHVSDGQVENPILTCRGEERIISWSNSAIRDTEGNITGTLSSGEDITERKEIEDALRTSEKKYRFLIDNINDVVWAVTPDFRLTFISNSVEKLTGRTVDEVMGRSILEFLTEESAEFVRQRNRMRQEDAGSSVAAGAGVFEVEMIRKDGGTRWAEVSSTPVTGADGKISGFQGIMRDVTERRKAEIALQESEAKFREIFDKANDGIHIHTIHADGLPGTFVEVNESACRMLQHSREELLGRSPLDFTTDYHSKPLSIIGEELRESGHTTFETQHRRKDGTVFPVEINAHAVTLQGKKVVLSIIRDITERKRSLEAIRASDEKFRAISETALDAVFVKDTQRRYTHVNPAMERLFGIPAVDILGKTADEVFDRETSRQMRADDELVLAGTIMERDFTVGTAGKMLVLHAIRVPMRDTDEHITGICGIARDITERKKTEEQVLASLREKEVLLKEIHHRVKNNMQVISSLLNLQAREITDPKTMNVIRESQSRVKSMALVHEKMYQSNNLAAIEFGDYIRSLVPNLIHQFGKKNVSCTIEADPIHLEVDTAIPCGLIVNELVTNALKHAFPRGQDGMIGIAFRTIDNRGVILTVRDNGVGFPPGIDFRNTTSLGMKLVNSLVKQIGGTIDMITGTGTTYTITFPRTEK